MDSIVIAIAIACQISGGQALFYKERYNEEANCRKKLATCVELKIKAKAPKYYSAALNSCYVEGI